MFKKFNPHGFFMKVNSLVLKMLTSCARQLTRSLVQVNFVTEHKFLCFYGLYFKHNFRTVHGNDTCNIPLERYGNSATFTYRKFFQILYSLKII